MRAGFVSLNRFFSVALMLGACLSLVGCGGEKEKGAQKLGAVTGKVTLDGNPVADATVTFTSEKNLTSIGTTDATGKYTATFGPTAGVVLGENTVKITVSAKQEHDANGAVKMVAATVIPEKYNTSTTLKVTVKAGANTHDFDLKSN